MQKSWFYLGAIGSLAILMSGCGDSKPAATPAPSPTASASPTPSPAAAAPTTPAPTASAPTPAAPAPAVAAKPKTSAVKPVSVDVAAGLIPPTNGENWAKTVAKGRTNPFATLAFQPSGVTEKDPLGQSGKPQPTTGKIATSQLPTIKNAAPAVKSGVNSPLPKIKIATVTSNTPIASKGTTTAEPSIARYGDTSISSIPRTGINRKLPKITVAIKPSNSSNSATPAKTASNTKVGNSNVLRPINMGSNPSATPRPTDIAARSPQGAEQALQAKAVEVSGVIEVEGKTQVIVKLPNETFSRYVNVGDKIANSNIVVKRIDDRGTISPTIVLSEGGTEVSHKIGDKPASQAPAK
ncbi:hypothetical protein [Chamaesiphon sp. VAR_69_metabat_338]|uniref:hypothetical protein n=1 Tax=Chamaesiphon sp. VAR_69_metabat_338 TaxID=2964704 RepID=UPI00286E9D38|nr:hypothetical protein [Chamaesiphon sp. VAR_69_metabat_338]